MAGEVQNLRKEHKMMINHFKLLCSYYVFSDAETLNFSNNADVS
jgi:hypothetical protein